MQQIQLQQQRRAVPKIQNLDMRPFSNRHAQTLSKQRQHSAVQNQTSAFPKSERVKGFNYN